MSWGAGEAVGRVEDVRAPRLEDPAREVEVRPDVVRVEVLEELVAIDDVGAAIGQIQVVAVVDDVPEIRGDREVLVALVGDVTTPDDLRFAGSFGRLVGEPAVPGSKLDERDPGAEVGAQEAHLAGDDPLVLGVGGLTGMERVIRDPPEKLVVELARETMPLFAGGVSKAASELALHFVMETQSLRTAARARYRGAVPAYETEN